tara:strand:+ start:34 stop:972 length:939 start_codon:yes stop_codon:yes gene_type:complete
MNEDMLLAWEDLDKIIGEREPVNFSHSICCLHAKIIYNPSDQAMVCLECAEVIETEQETCEWNNHKKDDGSFQNSNQRGDANISDNPYDKSGSIPSFSKKSLAMTLHYQQTFSHKQKTFWKVSEQFENYRTLLSLPHSILPTAKNMWHVCMESGKLTRASVRVGLISACLYFSAMQNNVSIDRSKLIELTEGSGNQKGFLKGEKVFLEIMQDVPAYKYLGRKKEDNKDTDVFAKFCNQLELPFKTIYMCNEIYTKNKDRLDSVTPKSITAGILFYVVKNELKFKQPSKSKISQVVDVCIPTINKVVKILESI